MATWNELLRQAREDTGLSRRALSERSGLSEDIIFSYEQGRRGPRRETVLQLTRAMNLDGGSTNAILEAAGLEPEPSTWVVKAVIAHRSLTELPGELAAYRWPCFAANERFEIVAWNEAAERVAELDFARDTPTLPKRNLLRLGAMRHIRERLLNWDEVVGFMVSQWKGHHMGREDLINGSPYFQALVRDITEYDSDSLTHLMRLWESVPAIETQPTRMVYRVEWRHSDGTTLQFDCLLTPWSDFDAVAIHDWHPGDAATWTWLSAAH